MVAAALGAPGLSHAAPQWCSGTLAETWVNSGNVFIRNSWHSDHYMICSHPASGKRRIWHVQGMAFDRGDRRRTKHAGDHARRHDLLQRLPGIRECTGSRLLDAEAELMGENVTV